MDRTPRRKEKWKGGLTEYKYILSHVIVFSFGNMILLHSLLVLFTNNFFDDVFILH